MSLFQESSVKETIEEIEFIPIEPIKEESKEMSNEEKFIKVCLEALDTDPSTPDTVDDEVGCADTVSHLLKKVFPDFPILVSTKDLDHKMFMDKRFKRMEIPNRGRIVISPRTNTKYGHVGVFITNERIASNDSRTGLFQGNYTWESWIEEFKFKRKLKIYIYELQ